MLQYNCQFKQPGTHVIFSFGSKCRGSRTGIIFNNEMDDFSTPGTSNSFGVPASPANYIAPGKMPMSSMTPTLVLDADNRVVLSTGGAGGTRITTASAWVRNQEEHPETTVIAMMDQIRSKFETESLLIEYIIYTIL